MNMFVIKSCNIKVGLWVRGVNVKWSEASLTCCIWPCFDVCVLAWTDGSWLGHRWSVNGAMNAVKSSEQTPDHESSMRKPDLHPASNKEHKNGECIIIPEQNVKFNLASKSWKCLASCNFKHCKDDNQWRALLVNLYCHNSRVSSNCPKVTLIKCVYTFTLVWH